MGTLVHGPYSIALPLFYCIGSILLHCSLFYCIAPILLHWSYSIALALFYCIAPILLHCSYSIALLLGAWRGLGKSTKQQAAILHREHKVKRAYAKTPNSKRRYTRNHTSPR